ncbi:hypothetical protein KM043_011137 [Ampulex compressa]|nr:hypothetical protein KM043_011137 [Ampulex compressa]
MSVFPGLLDCEAARNVTPKVVRENERRKDSPGRSWGCWMSCSEQECPMFRGGPTHATACSGSFVRFSGCVSGAFIKSSGVLLGVLDVSGRAGVGDDPPRSHRR